MSRLLQGIRKTLFWSYERGTLPYDLMVIAVVLWVFVTPRVWFNDRPQAGAGAAGGEIVRQSEDAASGVITFRVPARMLSETRADPGFVRRAHDVLSKNVRDLQNRPFQIRGIEVGQDKDGTVLYYDVTVK